MHEAEQITQHMFIHTLLLQFGMEGNRAHRKLHSTCSFIPCYCSSAWKETEPTATAQISMKSIQGLQRFSFCHGLVESVNSRTHSGNKKKKNLSSNGQSSEGHTVVLLMVGSLFSNADTAIAISAGRNNLGAPAMGLEYSLMTGTPCL
ncbi:hypothetical protein DUNSADRAFT_8698 [Dunaliella salina]|uniref:Encoded protein n=1 Tax=Dunaliella salina TaxID=3046 RepID=A0ABQ7FT67_DUNSA|nr:hypothetical protein DUNSADRAFT_8698 [Dunaliella salina]|eukprot:KAF5825557.1 hypothetical protein DUNSADRAFT_8698 [Dunaliella salina]